MNYPFLATSGMPTERKPSVSAKPTKRKSSIPQLREWEMLNFEHLALHKTKSQTRHPDVLEGLQQRIDSLEKQINARRKARGTFTMHGCQAVLFFIQYPKMIPVMAQEISARREARRQGQDVTHEDLNNSILSAYCSEHSNLIFSHETSACGDNTWSDHFFRVRNNFIETMGRAAQAADKAFQMLQHLEKEREDSIRDTPIPPTFPTVPQKPDVPPVPPVPPPESTRVQSHWGKFRRTSERAVDELLQNRCDGYVTTDDEPVDFVPVEPQKSSEPKPIASHDSLAKQKLYVQTDFLKQLERQ